MFLPTTPEELRKKGWDRLDILLVTGDTYIDSPHIGTAVIGRLLAAAGHRVGIIAQPDMTNDTDIRRLGEPRLFWGVTGGCMDSLVANYTALKKKRRGDDLTPGGKNDRRPDRAVIVYANWIRRCFKNTKPIVAGGIEASLRRIAHYDYWSDAVRRSILFDARIDILAYGMAEKTVLEIAGRLNAGKSLRNIRGTCVIENEPPAGYLMLPSFEEAAAKPKAFLRMFGLFCANQDPATASGLVQQHAGRYLAHHPPQPHLSTAKLDAVYALPFTRRVHPFYAKQGKVRAMHTIAFSLTTHRGCFGKCRFCSIASHEGRTILSRSEESILQEAQKIAALPDFRGTITDVGGATANMYGIDCARQTGRGVCADKPCLNLQPCPSLRNNHSRQIRLLSALRKIPGVKKVFVASGVRHDLLLADKKHGAAYLRELVRHHISGQLKIAPEHTVPSVLNRMGKFGTEKLTPFKKLFDKINKEEGRKQFLSYYFIAAHPGCAEKDMRELKSFAFHELHAMPRQVQIFTPLPSTWSALMYWTGIDPKTGRKIYVEKDLMKKQRQKDIATARR
ncbi:MAG: YgiQ family radical SAM protein [Smithella sp.]|nr:YgiQ family radical SAM protein [Smithella sp.]